MNGPRAVSAPVKLAIARTLKAVLETLSDDEYWTFVEAKRYAEEALPELISAGTDARRSFAFFVVKFGAARLFVKFEGRTNSLVITGFELGDYDPPPSPFARQIAHTQVVLAWLDVEPALFWLDHELDITGTPLSPRVGRAAALPSITNTPTPALTGVRKIWGSESGSLEERRPRRRSAFFGAIKFQVSFAPTVGERHQVSTWNGVGTHYPVHFAPFKYNKRPRTKAAQFSVMAQGVAVTCCSLVDAPSLSSLA